MIVTIIGYIVYITFSKYKQLYEMYNKMEIDNKLLYGLINEGDIKTKLLKAWIV